MENWLHDAGYVVTNNGQFYKDYYANNIIIRKITIVIVQSEWAITILEVDENSISSSVRNTYYANINEMINNYELI